MHSFPQAGMVTHAYNLSTWEAEAGGLPWIPHKPRLWNNLSVSLGYRMRQKTSFPQCLYLNVFPILYIPSYVYCFLLLLSKVVLLCFEMARNLTMLPKLNLTSWAQDSRIAGVTGCILGHKSAGLLFFSVLLKAPNTRLDNCSTTIVPTEGRNKQVKVHCREDCLVQTVRGRGSRYPQPRHQAQPWEQRDRDRLDRITRGEVKTVLK